MKKDLLGVSVLKEVDFAPFLASTENFPQKHVSFYHISNLMCPFLVFLRMFSFVFECIFVFWKTELRSFWLSVLGEK